MPKYFVTVSYYRIENLIVEAENKEAAEDVAYDLIGDDRTDVHDISISPFVSYAQQEEPEKDPH
jgi:hypothetical protein